MGQSSQFHWGSRIHILKIGSDFYILLVSLGGASPENFSSAQLPFLFRFYGLLSISGYTFQFWEAIIRNSQIYKVLEDSPLNICLGSSLETV